MLFGRLRPWRWLRPLVILGVFGVVTEGHASEASKNASRKSTNRDQEAKPIRDVRSRRFVVHTDLPPEEAQRITERLEVMLDHFCRYWGHPLRGAIECYVMHDLDNFPAATVASAGGQGVKTAGGITLMQHKNDGKRRAAKSVVYANSKMHVVQHEAVHAYCHQTYGRVGPVWYAEGMAEMGHFWNEGDTAVRADSREIDFLHQNPPKSLAAPTSPDQTTGDGWRNYASRWALCHFLLNNPNYSRQFRQLGRGFLTGKDVSFEQTYAATSRQLFFEYLLFLQNISPGYRVDLCAWDWKKRFAPIRSEQSLSAKVSAGRGWQPSGLTIPPGTTHDYVVSGKWSVAGASIDANGDQQGRGRLVGALMSDDRLGDEFELGAEGTLQLQTGGDLYLRCRNAWNALPGDQGTVTVNFDFIDDGSSVGDLVNDCRPNLLLRKSR